MSEVLSDKEARNKKLITELGSQILSLPIFDISPLGGRVSYNYEINHRWILKLPAKGTQISEWIKQSKYTPALQNQLTYQIPVSKVKSAITSSNKKIVGCFYPKIEGEIISNQSFHRQSKTQKIHYFEEVSDALSQLHQIHPESLPIVFQPKIECLSEFLFPHSPYKDKIFHKILTTIFEYANVEIKNQILTHSDLHSENICLGGKRKVQGILDFDMLSLGDTWMEFSPHLYHKDEQAMFRQIYQERSGNSINPKAIKCMNKIASTILFLNALGGLSIPVRQKQTTHFFQKAEKTY